MSRVGGEPQMEYDPQTADILSLKPRFREDLTIVKQRTCGCESYLINDDLGRKVHRMGQVEYAFATYLNGRRTVGDALSIVSSQFGMDALHSEEAISLVGWLAQAQLVVTRRDDDASRKSDAADEAIGKATKGRLSVLTQRIPFFNPDRVVQRVVAKLPLKVWTTLALVAIGLIVFGGYLILHLHREVIASRNDIFSTSNAIILILVWVGLKLIHEMGHAITCAIMGARVREFGIVFVLFVPMPYVDVTSAWMLKSKWKRISVSVAGMLTEMVAASLAMIVFWHSNAPWVQMQALNIVYLATITTLLFNLNPLMRFDGYYILTDWLELPNLATNGQRLMRYHIDKCLWGTNGAMPQWPEGHYKFVMVYAIAASCWRLLISVTLIYASSAMFEGAGIVIAVIAIFSLLGKKMMNWVTRFLRIGEMKRSRVGWTFGIGFATLAVALFVPVPRSITVPAAVRMSDHRSVRVGESGFLQNVSVRAGDKVVAGQRLCQLSSPRLEADKEELEAELNLSVQKQRMHQSSHDLVALQIESDRGLAYRQRLQELTDRMNQLVVVAPANGVVLRCDANRQRGRYLRRGHVLCEIGNPIRYDITAFVPQSDLSRLASPPIQSGQLAVNGQSAQKLSVKFEVQSARAAQVIEFHELSSTSGGRLMVYQTPGKDQSEHLVEPHVRLTSTVERSIFENDAISVSPGIPAAVRLELNRQTIASILTNQWWY